MQDLQRFNPSAKPVNADQSVSSGPSVLLLSCPSFSCLGLVSRRFGFRLWFLLSLPLFWPFCCLLSNCFFFFFFFLVVFYFFSRFSDGVVFREVGFVFISLLFDLFFLLCPSQMFDVAVPTKFGRLLFRV